MEARSVVGALLLLLAGLVGPVRADERVIAIRAGHLIDTVGARLAGAHLAVPVLPGRDRDHGRALGLYLAERRRYSAYHPGGSKRTDRKQQHYKRRAL